jgi:hypothetical protein
LFSPISDSEISRSEKSDSDFQAAAAAKDPELLTQSELNDLVRDLGLLKDLVEILGSSLCGGGGGDAWSRDVVLLVQTSRR